VGTEGGAIGVARLVERDEELAAIDSALDAARSGTGGLLLVEGPAGIGKTSLLSEGRSRAATSGTAVLHGVGTEFEREYPFGVVRQALVPLVQNTEDRERLLTGAGSAFSTRPPSGSEAGVASSMRSVALWTAV
jgi:predicted ATPase